MVPMLFGLFAARSTTGPALARASRRPRGACKRRGKGGVKVGDFGPFALAQGRNFAIVSTDNL